jgi:hypothetical protein
MSMVRHTLTEDSKLSDESLKRLAALEDRPIDFSDIPELTPKQLERLQRRRAEGRDMQMFTYRRKNGYLKWFMHIIGEECSVFMSRLLKKTAKHPKLIKECL